MAGKLALRIVAINFAASQLPAFLPGANLYFILNSSKFGIIEFKVQSSQFKHELLRE
jgi:hypothetical protein